MMPPNIIWRIYHRHNNESSLSAWLDSSPEMEKFREEREKQFCKEFIIELVISLLIMVPVMSLSVYMGLHPEVMIRIIEWFSN